MLLRTIEELPSVQRWVAMVQREVGERLAAAPGSGAYGMPSVLAQLACEVERPARDPAHRLSPRAERRLGARCGCAGAPRLRAASRPRPPLRALVSGAFAHRRKTLAGSLALAGAAGGRSRAEVRAALRELGHAADVRAERLSPEDFRALARLLGL